MYQHCSIGFVYAIHLYTETKIIITNSGNTLPMIKRYFETYHAVVAWQVNESHEDTDTAIMGLNASDEKVVDIFLSTIIDYSAATSNLYEGQVPIADVANESA